MNSNNLVKIAFIDDGINPEPIPKNICFENYTADENGVKPDKPISEASHGTLCYQIFHSTVYVPYNLVSIKVLDSYTGTGNHKSLVSALNWCANQDINIINMSMGTRQYLDFAPISDAIKRLSDIIIVAACSNENELTFPACLPYVIGVRHCNHEDLTGKFTYIDTPYDQIEILTCAKYGQMDGANSFAAPLITARVCDYIARGFSGIAAIREQLRKNSSCFAMPDYGFYKRLLLKWEDLNIPIVAIPENADKYAVKLKSLIQCFVQDGYRAVGLTTRTETSAEDLVFSLNRQGATQVELPDLIELYYNFMLPDIIFLHIELPTLIKLPKKLQADITLSAPDLSKSTESIFLQITKLLA